MDVFKKMSKTIHTDLQKVGPKGKGSSSIGTECLACRKNFKEGDFTTLIPLGPGEDEEQRLKCREGRPYNAIGQEIHWVCATGEI